MIKSPLISRSGIGSMMKSIFVLILVTFTVLLIGCSRITPTTEAGDTATDVSQVGEVSASASPTTEAALPSIEAPSTSLADEVYPPPLPTPQPLPTSTPLPTPTPTATLIPYPQTPPYPAGKAATLHNGNIWLIEPGKEPQQLTDFGDVAGIFGWNPEGTHLLFGRGRNTKHAEFQSDMTQLWYLDLPHNQYVQITENQVVSSAAWSPQGDKIAYSEDGHLVTIVDLQGNKLYQQDHVLLGFSWSPDGRSLAVRYYTPKMDQGNVVFAVLAIWQFEQGILQTVDDLWEVGDAFPIWSMDGQLIFFQRNYYGQDQNQLKGFLVFNLTDRTIKPLEFEDPYNIYYIGRSPHMDLILIEEFLDPTHSDLYTIDFDGNVTYLIQGLRPTWCSDGKTIIYRANSGTLQSIQIESDTYAQNIVGGDHTAVNMYITPEYYFVPTK